jgi:putative tricarboxylic transport membrane protein
MKRAEVIAGLGFLTIGGVVMWEGIDLGVGRLRQPGAGFSLVGLGGALIALSLLVAIQGLADRGASPVLFRDTRWGRVLATVIALVTYAAVLPLIGFLAATPILLLVLLRAIDPVRWPIAGAIAVSASGITWYVIQKWLAIQLPAGSLWEFVS